MRFAELLRPLSVKDLSREFFSSQFARLLIEYQEHPEAKSLAPDGTPCQPDTSGVLQLTSSPGKFAMLESDLPPRN
jgi:hypothetical protein